MRLAPLLFLVACGAPAPPAQPTPPAQKVALKDVAWGKFHSSRHAVSLWLPDGHAWRIDDHSLPELIATHPSGAHVSVRLIQDAGELTNRERCETKARIEKFVQATSLGVVSEQEGIDRNGWDAHVVVGVETSKDRTVGHVLSFASSIRKCLWVHVEVPATDPGELQDLLLLGETKILGKLAIDPFGEIPRQPPRVGK